jgi:hypothetical protein
MRAWEMLSDGSFRRRSMRGKGFDAQAFLMSALGA